MDHVSWKSEILERRERERILQKQHSEICPLLAFGKQGTNQELKFVYTTY